MAFIVFITWVLLSTNLVCIQALAYATAPGFPVNPTSCCIPPAAASQLVDDYIYHIAQNYSDSVAQAALAENVTVTSQSANALMGKNASTGLNGITFDGKTAVIAGETSQPKMLELISIDAIGCSAIAFRWWGIPGPPTSAPVRAISVFHVIERAGGTWQVSEIFGEFNSVTWGEDTGAQVVLPAPPPSK